MAEEKPIIVWFRRDLRTADNAALHFAAESGGPVIPVFVWSPEEEGESRPGAASRWWLHYSLAELGSRLADLGLPLIFRQGSAEAVLIELCRESGAEAVFWNRLYEPALIKRDSALKEKLHKEGLEARSFPGNLLFEPWELQNSEKKPYQVFGAFFRALKARAKEIERTLPSLKNARAPERPPASGALEDFKLLPKIDWAVRFPELWQPGERGAQAQLKRFLKSGLDGYAEGRDLPEFDGTSRLSPHLHFGEISVRALWHAAAAQADKKSTFRSSDLETFRSEIAWREFSHHLLYYFPDTSSQPLRREFSAFPWKSDRKRLKAWQQGKTGYPVVDAGMRQLWLHGWMHNRVRMVAASFLVKDLLIPWQDGAQWFLDTLVDADLANNTMGWQWTAGCGADAAPFFRVFNPVLQGQKFDPDGNYVRRFVPELEKLPKKWIHRPWEAPEEVLAEAGVSLGASYPRPVVDHDEAREDALEAFEALKEAKTK